METYGQRLQEKVRRTFMRVQTLGISSYQLAHDSYYELENFRPEIHASEPLYLLDDMNTLYIKEGECVLLECYSKDKGRTYFHFRRGKKPDAKFFEENGYSLKDGYMERHSSRENTEYIDRVLDTCTVDEFVKHCAEMRKQLLGLIGKTPGYKRTYYGGM